MKYLFAVLLMFPLCGLADDIDLPKQRADAFLESIIKGDISDAYDRLFEGSTLPADKPQDVVALKQQTQVGLPLYGKTLGYELVKEEKFGESLVRLSYLLKSEKGPTVWVFHFYRPEDSWILAGVNFTDQLQQL